MSTDLNSGPDGRLREPGGGGAEGAQEEARRTAREMTDRVEQKARAKGEELRERVEEKGEEQKERAASRADTLAEAIRAAGATLRDRHEDRLGEFTDEFAHQVERFSGYLRDNDMRGLVRNLEDVARRNPAGFLGGTLSAGLVAGRFMGSSARDPERPREDSGQPHRPPSHQEFGSTERAAPLQTGMGGSRTGSTPVGARPGRASTYDAGGPTS
jgi:hypothetical protein